MGLQIVGFLASGGFNNSGDYFKQAPPFSFTTWEKLAISSCWSIFFAIISSMYLYHRQESAGVIRQESNAVV